MVAPRPPRLLRSGKPRTQEGDKARSDYEKARKDKKQGTFYAEDEDKTYRSMEKVREVPVSEEKKKEEPSSKQSIPIFNDGIVVGVVHKGLFGMVYSGRPEFNPLGKKGTGLGLKGIQKFNTPAMRAKAKKQYDKRIKEGKGPGRIFSKLFRSKLAEGGKVHRGRKAGSSTEKTR
tara:strand:+ start:643 stop:1167 length:525 start_codon:yes stop_codon:yes gene_type:complete